MSEFDDSGGGLQPGLQQRIAAGFGQSNALELVPEVVALMAERGTFAEAEAAAHAAVSEAKGALSVLPKSPSLELLLAAADFVVARQS